MDDDVRVKVWCGQEECWEVTRDTGRLSFFCTTN